MKNPSAGGNPRHIAVIMDGNGRWAAARALPRTAGHGMGVRTVKQIVETCAQRGIEVLTLFAFSSENWQRPREEVSMLMNRFLEALDEEIEGLHRNGIKVRFVGNLSQLSTALRERMEAAMRLTANNAGMDAGGRGCLWRPLGHRHGRAGTCPPLCCRRITERRDR